VGIFGHSNDRVGCTPSKQTGDSAQVSVDQTVIVRRIMQKTGKKTMGFRDKMAMVARRIGSLQYSVPEFSLPTPDVCM
jgi:hypothetical protein